ncbi:unnamed protein product [Rotaria magnacalcarata]|uniref:Uncharacterized protein n=1 Tax=Rotaria magnacalcarata TaxID=392030 RepID=A0A817AB25_9BILA|nr:unnamed protein product [Rotaria magnacalcarata]
MHNHNAFYNATLIRPPAERYFTRLDNVGATADDDEDVLHEAVIEAEVANHQTANPDAIEHQEIRVDVHAEMGEEEQEEEEEEAEEEIVNEEEHSRDGGERNEEGCVRTIDEPHNPHPDPLNQPHALREPCDIYTNNQSKRRRVNDTIMGSENHATSNQRINNNDAQSPDMFEFRAPAIGAELPSGSNVAPPPLQPSRPPEKRRRTMLLVRFSA